MLHRCQDETYASAVGLDFTLGTTANLNYVRLQGRRMVEVVSDCYRQVGLSGQCGSQPDDTGTERLPALHTAENVVKQLFGEVDAALAKLPRRCNAVRLSQTHNVIATRLYAALKLLLAGRSLSEETMTARSLDPDSGLVELVDKRPAPYHEYRIVLLPPYCRAWISTYLAWLSSLAYRLDTINPPLSRDIAGIVDRSDPVVRHPLFFRIMPDGRTCPLGSADIAKLLAGHGIAPNAGRHLVDKLFRDAGLDSAVVMAWMGRGMPGQEAYGSGSAAVPLDVMRTGSEVIETWLATLRLPQVLQIAPRQLGLSHTQIKKPAKYTPQLLTERPASLRHSKGMERCPFAEATPRLSAEYSRILQAWRRSAPPEGLAAVALSLVLEDGVQHVDELHATLDALQCGPIHAHEDLHFVDSRSSTLGIRRVWLSPVTLRLALQTQHSDPTTRSDRSLTGAIAALLVRANVSASGDPLQHLVRAAQAFAGLRVPGILRAWMDGTKMARTSRPETVARELLGRCESPQFATTEQIPRRSNPEFVFKRLRELAEEVDRGKSHRAAIDEMRRHLSNIAGEGDFASEQELLVGYCSYLATEQSNIRTIARYMDACRPFVAKVATALSTEGALAIDWAALATQALEGRPAEASLAPERTAIQHFLSWQGIDLRIGARMGPPPSTLIYVDRLTPRECHLAVSLLTRKRERPGDDWHRAEVALRLTLEGVLRWSEVANLRVCDVALRAGAPHIVVTQESDAALKTSNAPRVLPLCTEETLDALSELHQLRLARYPTNGLVPLLGDDDEERATESTERIHALVTDALRRASGSAHLHPHSTRHTVITREVRALLLPERAQKDRPLVLRQGLFRISALAGHGHFDVTVSHYLQDLDHLRRRWMDFLLADTPSPSIAFLARVTGIPAPTLRKRASRGAPPPDLMEGLQPDQAARSGITITSLTSLVDAELTHIPWASSHARLVDLTASTTYLGLRLLGDSERTARLASRLPPDAAQALERALTLIQRSRVARMIARPISRERFLADVTATHLGYAIEVLLPERSFLRTVITAIQTVGEPLAFRTPEDALEFARFVPPLAAAGIHVVVDLRRTERSSVDTYALSRLTGHGFTQTKLQPARCFPRGSSCLIRFVPAPSSDSTVVHASAQLAFHATVALIAVQIAGENQNETNARPFN